MKSTTSIFYILLLIFLISCNKQDESKAQERVASLPEEATEIDTTATAKPEIASLTIDSTFLIIPGERVGQISLGMSAESVNNLLGKADSGDAAMGKALSFWISKSPNRPRHYLAIYSTLGEELGPQYLVRQIQITSPQFHTSDSIRTGKYVSIIRSKYDIKPIAYYTNKNNERIYIFDDQRQGIAFEIDAADSTCTAITVHSAGEKIKKTYLPIHPDMVLL